MWLLNPNILLPRGILYSLIGLTKSLTKDITRNYFNHASLLFRPRVPHYAVMPSSNMDLFIYPKRLLRRHGNQDFLNFSFGVPNSRRDYL